MRYTFVKTSVQRAKLIYSRLCNLKFVDQIYNLNCRPQSLDSHSINADLQLSCARLMRKPDKLNLENLPVRWCEFGMKVYRFFFLKRSEVLSVRYSGCLSRYLAILAKHLGQIVSESGTWHTILKVIRPASMLDLYSQKRNLDSQTKFTNSY